MNSGKYTVYYHYYYVATHGLVLDLHLYSLTSGYRWANMPRALIVNVNL